ncbi:MAG: Stp1/IreP family PP2C-type Ser/Thr phosphatase [Candidatus Riflebacteria bacterium]|nr:Stp1/IreP family PP2C-type Ser/Thr phosphatase [Candidatus Riflebacteria bacterium]
MHTPSPPVMPGLAERPSRVQWSHDVLEVAGLSDVGLVRAKNEDSFYIAEPPRADLARGVLLAVADGMGGHLAGEVASSCAVDFMSTYYSDEPFDGTIEEKLSQKVVQANETLLALAQTSQMLEGMGTTLSSALLVENGKLVICHVGDSRIYLLREGELEAQTNDHSFVGEQVRLGLLTEDEARVHPARNIITRALGIRTRVEPELSTLDLKPGDRILLASDGLHGYVEEAQIRQALMESPCASEAAARLVGLALDAGGMDNVTVVVATIREIDRMIERLADKSPGLAYAKTLPGLEEPEK